MKNIIVKSLEIGDSLICSENYGAISAQEEITKGDIYYVIALDYIFGFDGLITIASKRRLDNPGMCSPSLTCDEKELNKHFILNT